MIVKFVQLTAYIVIINAGLVALYYCINIELRLCHNIISYALIGQSFKHNGAVLVVTCLNIK